MKKIIEMIVFMFSPVKHYKCASCNIAWTGFKSHCNQCKQDGEEI